MTGKDMVAFLPHCSMCGVTRHVRECGGWKFRICGLCDGPALKQGEKTT